MPKSNPQDAEPRADERLPWHRPEVQWLAVNLDTAKTPDVPDAEKDGSGEDLLQRRFMAPR